MGKTALELDENETEGQEVVVEEDRESEDGEASQDEDGNPIRKLESAEVEIVLDDGDGSQPEQQHNIDRIVRKRVNRLNTKVAKVEEDSQLKDQKIQLLELALKQQKDQPVELVPPNPRDFDDGSEDSKYVEALQNYNKGYLDEQVKQATAKLVMPQGEMGPDAELESSQIRHYQSAQTLGIKDYEETEDRVIDILGKDTVNQLIKNSDRSHITLYYLGKNLDKAEEIADLIKTNPIKGTLQLGVLEERLIVKPRGQMKSASDPDEELRGGSSNSAKKRGPTGATYS